jgi:predicted ATPase
LKRRVTIVDGPLAFSMSRFRAARATVDWSHSLLDDDERRLFRRLAVFPLHFSADAARHIAAPEHEEPWRVTDLLADLVAKSLLLSDVAGSAPQYRFLETIRFYALEKLADSGEVASTAERHASANPDSLRSRRSGFPRDDSSCWGDGGAIAASTSDNASAANCIRIRRRLSMRSPSGTKSKRPAAKP